MMPSQFYAEDEEYRKWCFLGCQQCFAGSICAKRFVCEVNLFGVRQAGGVRGGLGRECGSEK
jgi:hypothetical protein